MRLIQQGPRDAKILICGEAPGETEDRTGVPFCGGSGVLLDTMLHRANISRQECFVTNVVHHRPPKNDFQWFFGAGGIRPQLAEGIIQLKKDIEDVRPNVVAALGGWALLVLTGKDKIDKWRGSVLESNLVVPCKVVGTYHPAHCLRFYDFKAVAEIDLCKVAAESTKPDISRIHRTLILDPDRQSAIELLSELRRAEWLSVDIECWRTAGGYGREIACVGFADRRDRAITFPFDSQWKRDIVRELLLGPARKVFQNAQYDLAILRDNGYEVNNFSWDTMLAHHSLFPECAAGEDELTASGGKKRQNAIKKGLAFLTSIYTDVPRYKDDGKEWEKTGDLMLFWRYNALDCAVTREVRDVQEGELAEYDTIDVFDREMSLVPACMDSTHRGIRIDLELRAKLKEKYEKEIDNLQDFLDGGAGRSVNVKSSQQVCDLLYGSLGLPVKRNKDTGNPTADKDAITELAAKHAHPILLTILEIRRRRDFIERYLDARVDADGRMRCSWDITGTVSGRLSSRQSIYGSGTNLQNIPARTAEGEAIRRMFIADEGKAFVYRDYSQAEARVVAYQAECLGLINLFEDPTRDIHKENAARIFGKSVGEITPTERYLAKRVVHASNYGMGEDKLVAVVNEDASTTGVRIERAEAKRLIERYFMLYPEIKQNYWREVTAQLNFDKTLTTPLRRKRTFYGRWDDKLLREAYSYIPQSVVGDLGGMAFVRCHDRLEQEFKECWTLLNVHDAILVQCRVQDVEAVAERMAELMRIPVTIRGRTFYIPTDGKVGFNWGSMTSDNPRGLLDIEKWRKAA